jgi:predicted alpha/beta-hydrolase family hydrolase
MWSTEYAAIEAIPLHSRATGMVHSQILCDTPPPKGSPVEHTARFEEVEIRLPEPLNGLDRLSAVVGIPEWWPTGARVAVAIAHDAGADYSDPLVECVHRNLAQRKFLTIRFNFPFAEAGTDASGDDVETLDKAYRAALSILGRDPTAAPAHLFLGGVGLGSSVAAHLATARLQIDGLFSLGYPLHPPGRPEDSRADSLYRIIPPMLFVQGSADPTCELPALRHCLARVGAPTTLRILEGADSTLTLPGQSEAELEGNRRAVSSAVTQWIEKILQTG